MISHCRNFMKSLAGVSNTAPSQVFDVVVESPYKPFHRCLLACFVEPISFGQRVCRFILLDSYSVEGCLRIRGKKTNTSSLLGISFISQGLSSLLRYTHPCAITCFSRVATSLRPSSRLLQEADPSLDGCPRD